ncbi:hypothetical protein FGO68_gene2287 [Halteria grandinella]|uniref:Uncharacterized protein n=1 Tax=Halteria grandinella TaxID=5974 RepID=A0A8J8SY02_HALGN|nr:hypothetical protein FGO68_gene2287 [Halteria grandinella]
MQIKLCQVQQINKDMKGLQRLQRYGQLIIKKYPQVLSEDLSNDVQSTPLARAVWRNDIYLVDILMKVVKIHYLEWGRCQQWWFFKYNTFDVGMQKRLGLPGVELS